MISLKVTLAHVPYCVNSRFVLVARVGCEEYLRRGSQSPGPDLWTLQFDGFHLLVLPFR